MKKLLSLLLSTILVLLLALPALADDGGGGYIVGEAEIYSTYDNEMLKDSFYYTDEWFSQDPAEVNHSLALLSMQLVASGVELDENGAVSAFLKNLGFESVGFSNSLSTDEWGCSYIWAKKKVEIGGVSRTLAAVIIQSYSDDQQTKINGWNQNFTVNDENAKGEHAGLAEAAESIIGEIGNLDASNNTIYWLMGHSRGGAVANLIAAHLPDVKPTSVGNIFAYTFESPNTVDKTYLPGKSYGYIHNYVCSDDVVTTIPVWGMTRYGNDWPLNTVEADAKLFENLRLLGSGAAEQEGSYDPSANVLMNVVDALATAIPTREDYSTVLTDYAQDPLGNDIPISYSYQDLFVKLSTLANSGAMSAFSATTFLENTDLIAPVLAMWINAVRYDDTTTYLSAASAFKYLLTSLGIDLPLELEDYYAILKLLGPYMLDPSKAPDSFDGDFSTYLPAVNPEVYTLFNIKPQVFSHHFDTAIARLKALAPMPEMDSPDNVIPEPTPPTQISGTLMTKVTAKGKNSLVLKWTPVKGADGYDIFFGKCGKNAPKKVRTIKNNKALKWTKKNLKNNTAYKVVVKAYVKKNGKKIYVRTSPTIHAYTSGGNKIYTNAKSVSVEEKKVSLTVGGTYSIKATVHKLNKKKELMSHTQPLRYKSSNTKIATVDINGKITAVAKGSCRIYVYAINGARKAVKVTVK